MKSDSIDMNKLYNNTIKKTVSVLNMDKQDYEKHIQKYIHDDIIDKLYKHIIKNSINKIKYASNNGKSLVVIYKYAGHEKFYYKFINFLIKGSPNEGLSWFTEKNIEPLIVKLKRYYKPFNVYTRFNMSECLNEIVVEWCNKEIIKLKENKMKENGKY